MISQSYLIASSLNRALGADDMDDIDPVEYAEKVLPTSDTKIG